MTKYKRSLDIVSRANPSAVVNGKSGRISDAAAGRSGRAAGASDRRQGTVLGADTGSRDGSTARHTVYDT